MDRNHTAPFQKKGPRAARIAEREIQAAKEQDVEKFVRDRMKPKLLAAAREATTAFNRRR